MLKDYIIKAPELHKNFIQYNVVSRLGLGYARRLAVFVDDCAREAFYFPKFVLKYGWLIKLYSRIKGYVIDYSSADFTGDRISFTYRFFIKKDLVLRRKISFNLRPLN